MQPGIDLTYQGPVNELIQSRLAAGGTVRFTVPTASMSPLLRIGDSVIAQGVRAADLRVGDMVVSQVGPIWRVHRLIALERSGDETWMVTKGDNSRIADERCPVPDWVGVVTAVCTRRGEQALDGAGVRELGRSIAMLSRWHYRFQPRGLGRVMLKLIDYCIYGTDSGLRTLTALAPNKS